MGYFQALPPAQIGGLVRVRRPHSHHRRVVCCSGPAPAGRRRRESPYLGGGLLLRHRLAFAHPPYPRTGPVLAPPRYESDPPVPPQSQLLPRLSRQRNPHNWPIGFPPLPSLIPQTLSYHADVRNPPLRQRKPVQVSFFQRPILPRLLSARVMVPR